MILLLGGTSETATLAAALAEAGYRVLVSMATDVSLQVGRNPNISHRQGRLNEAEMATLIREQGVRVIVDATHPYATRVRATAEEVANRLGIPYLTFVRPGVVMEGDGVRIAASHEEAARISCSAGKPVLLTTGAKNVDAYACEAQQANVVLVARVLNQSDSIEACRRAGIPDERIVTGRGPFSEAENRELIRRFGIGVLVTKDGGAAGGVPEKLAAARAEGCQVVVVGRPPQTTRNAFTEVPALVRKVTTELKGQETVATSKPSCLVLMAHGSRNPRWITPFEKLANDLKQEIGANKVHLAFMELSTPSLTEVAQKIVESGVTDFRLLPLFLASGHHLTIDVPAQVEEIKRQFPGLEIELLPPIGQHPLFTSLMRQVAREYMASKP